MAKKENQFKKKEVKRYLKHPNLCPFCGGADISVSSTQGEEVIYREVDCENCGEDWLEVFTLTTIEKNLI